MEVYYSTEGVNTKVELIRILHQDEGKPRMKDVQNGELYNLVIPSFITESRSVYGLTKGWWTNYKDIGKFKIISNPLKHGFVFSKFFQRR